MPSVPLKLFFDGGCRPNPGRIEIGVVVRGVTHILDDCGHGTNSDAEWLAAIHALRIAREGWSIRDVLAHGVIDYHPMIVGPPVEAADHMQTWFEAGACDGFWLCPDVYEDGLPKLVDELVPILQQRGLFREDYSGTTLRDHYGLPVPGRADALADVG